jgi:hypothetical protein|tara:strand:- start:64081 stop:65307 length:1227 start_codon:yes stop_codon:yes gene_type:complete
MANIKGQAGKNLSQELANYLDANQGNLSSDGLLKITNQYLSGGDKLGATGGSISNGIYKRFGEFDQINGKIEVVTTGLWSGDTGSLTSYFTSSAQSEASLNYYVNVYDKDPATDTSAAVQYAIAYGQKNASGSVSLTISDDSTLATKATYAQYRSILLDQNDDKFTFYSSSASGTHDSDDIYVINVARARYKEKMDAGNWSLVLSGSNGISTLIDDSGKKFSDTVGKAGRVFNVGSGSLNLGTEAEATINTLNSSNGEGLGLFYPDQGLIILNPVAIHDLVGNSIDSGSVKGASIYSGNAREGRNQFLLHNMIDGGNDFQARRTENVSTSHYFIRATNREYNFSNNPTFTTGSDGSFTESTFERDPRTFITTIGLINDANETIAVAKTSQPIPKSFDKEVLIKVKLDF